MNTMDVVLLDEHAAQELDLIAARMRATLVEVLGQQEGESLYSLEWLRDRAASHLDGTYPGAIFVARRRADAHSLGHVIVRQERDDDGALGLVSTIYVVPEARRSGVASSLLHAAHHWFDSRRLCRSATDTSQANLPLIRLFERFGYAVVFRSEEKKMVRLMKGSPTT